MNPFNAGQVIARAFTIWMRSIVPFTIVAFLCHLPLFALDYVASHGKLSPGLFGSLYTFVAALLSMVATGALTYGVFQSLRGQPASIGASLTTGMRRFFGVLGTSLIVGLATGVGLILFVVPGIIVLTMVFVAVPASVIERIGGATAANRSSDLTKGSRLQILGIAILSFGLGYGGLKLYGLIVPQPRVPSDVLPFLLGLSSVGAFLSPFQAACSAVTYHELRRVKEGADIEQLAAVFD